MAAGGRQHVAGVLFRRENHDAADRLFLMDESPEHLLVARRAGAVLGARKHGVAGADLLDRLEALLRVHRCALREAAGARPKLLAGHIRLEAGGGSQAGELVHDCPVVGQGDTATEPMPHSDPTSWTTCCAVISSGMF